MPRCPPLSVRGCPDGGAAQPHGGFVGVVGTQLVAREVVEAATARAREVCVHTYGVAPRVVVDGDADATLAGIPEHSEYVLYELLKNAERAVLECAGHRMRPAAPPSPPVEPAHAAAAGTDETALPPNVVTVAASTRDLVFRVSDQGHGIAPEHLPRVQRGAHR
jgi:signal transduction histidine kinase